MTTIALRLQLAQLNELQAVLDALKVSVQIQLKQITEDVESCP